MLLWVGEDFGVQDLDFSVLIDEREDEDRIVVDRNAVKGREKERELLDGYVSRSRTR